MLAELELVDRSIGIVGHGCYTQIITTADVEFLQCLHGRAPAVATGMKRMLPDRLVYTLQGDGDMVSEGLAEVLHTAARGESVTCLMLDNGVFGDTGGQMTATTTVGQRTKTDLDGRSAGEHGYPIPVADIVANFPGVAYVARGAVDKPNAIARTRRYLREAFRSQMAGEGFSLVEILTMCPTGWAVPTDQGARVPARPGREHVRPRRAASETCPPFGHGADRPMMDVRIHDLLARTALVQPNRIGATLGDEARTFAELDTNANRVTHRLAGEGVELLDRVVWWGPTALDALSTRLRHLEARRHARADQPELHRARGGLGPRDPAPATRRRRTRPRWTPPTPPPIRSACRSSSWTTAGSTVRRARSRPASVRARTRTSSSSPAGRPASPRGRCCRTAPRWLRAIAARARRVARRDAVARS